MCSLHVPFSEILWFADLVHAHLSLFGRKLIVQWSYSLGSCQGMSNVSLAHPQIHWGNTVHKRRVERYSAGLLCRTGACTLQASYSDKGGDEVLQSRRHSWILSDQRSVKSSRKVGIQVQQGFQTFHTRRNSNLQESATAILTV